MGAPTTPSEPTGPVEPGEPEPPPDSGDGRTTEPADPARRRLTPRAVAVAGIAAGGLAFLLGSAILVAALIAASRGSGDPPPGNDVAAELASLREELAKAGAGPGPAARELDRLDRLDKPGELKAQLAEVSRQIAGLERALAEAEPGRAAELEKALRDSEAARKAGQDALLAKGMRGPLHVFMDAARNAAKEAPGGGPLVDGGRGPDAELAQALREMARVAGLPSTPEASARTLQQRVKGYEKYRAVHLKQQETIRGRYEKLRQTVEKEVQKVVEKMHARARAAEKAKDWQTALACYRDIATVSVRGAEKIAAEGRKKVPEIQRRLLIDIRAPGPPRREAGPKARPGARPGKLPAGRPGDDEEVF